MFSQNPGFYLLSLFFLSQVQFLVWLSEEEANIVLKPFMKRFLSGVMYTFQIIGKLNSVNEAWEYFLQINL